LTFYGQSLASVSWLERGEDPPARLYGASIQLKLFMPKLFRVILPVSDLEKAAVFYGAVFQSPGQRVSPGRHYFDCGGTILACYEPPADGDGSEGAWSYHPKQYLYFSVPDLEAAFQRAQGAGATLDSAVMTMPWGERMFYARDPLGSQICFVDEKTLFTGH
jgi:predicted enzyme related to lactoylglutathione lyase